MSEKQTILLVDDEKNISKGHCKISCFEQPNLKLPIKAPSEQGGKPLFAESMNWLPDRNTQRTKYCKTVTEIVLYFYRFSKKSKILCFGDKPDFIPKDKIFTKRDFNSHLSKSKRKNPIIEGYKYLEHLESNPKLTYQNIGEEFNVTRERVCLRIALVKKLPVEITEFFLKENKNLDFSYFTERRLRPLTLLKTEKEKVERFEGMK